MEEMTNNAYMVFMTIFMLITIYGLTFGVRILRVLQKNINKSIK